MSLRRLVSAAFIFLTAILVGCLCWRWHVKTARQAVSNFREEPVPAAAAAAPLDRASVLEEQSSTAAPDGSRRSVQLVSLTSAKFPLLRVEQTTDHRGTRRVAMAAGHVLATLPAGTTEAEANALLRRAGLRNARHLRGTDVWLLHLPDVNAEAVPRALAALQREAVSAEPDYVFFASQDSAVFPNDPSFAGLWGLHNTGQTGGTADADVDAPAAWAIAQEATGVVVGVIDTGVDYSHPDLAPNIWTNPGETAGNNVDDDNNGYVDDVRGWDFVNEDNAPADDEGHGTHCAGTIGAAGNNSTGITGVCWSVKLMPLKFMDATGMGFSSDAVRAVAYATANGAKLTSNSWGGGGYSQTLYNTIQAAGAAGRLFIAAAGNDARNTDLTPDFPAGYNLPNIISVAATDHADQLAGFSNYGAVNVDLGAPGEDIFSTSPGGGYRYSSGTSMACPQVAGACALTFSAAPNLTALEIRQRIIDTADPVSALAGKCVSGGRLNLGALIAASAGPVLQMKSLRLSDGVAEGATGNGDGIFNPGESVVIFTEIENIGSEPASGVTGVLDIPSAPSALVVGNDSTGYGDIPARTSRPASVPFRVNITAAAPVPLVTPLRLALSAAGGRTWTFDIPFEVHQSLRLGGLVTQKTGGTPIAGAGVTFTGARTGEAITAADGHWEALVTEGTFTLTASAAGWLRSAPQAVTLPPQSFAVNFQLGRPQLQVSPLSLAATVNPGQSASSTLTVTNTGDEPLTFSWSPNYRVTGGTPPFRDDFERAVLGTEWNGNGEIVTGVAAAGTRSAHSESLYNYPFLHGLLRWLTAGSRPAYAAFSVRAASTEAQAGYFQLLDESNYRAIISFHCGADGKFTVNPDYGGDVSFPYEPLRWYRIEFLNIDWTARTFDYAVDGQVLRTGISFVPGTTSSTGRLLLGNSGFAAKAWWDEIIIADSGTGWLSGAPQGSTVPPGQSTVLNLTFSAAALSAGSYEADLLLNSNDPLGGNFGVPALLTVQPLSNSPPVATPASVTALEDTSLEITLGASDADGNSLLTRAVSVPALAAGLLFQVRTDGTQGAPIAANDIITHPARRVMYAPPRNAAGAALTSFSFKVSDGLLESAPATVTISVTPVNDPPSARNDPASSATGGALTGIPVLANDSDPDGDSLMVTAVGTAARGTAVLSGSGVNYTPEAGFTHGTDSFSYTISDGAGGSASAQVIVTVGEVPGGGWTTAGGNSARTGYHAAPLGSDPLVEVWSREFSSDLTGTIMAGGRVFASQRRDFGAIPAPASLRAFDMSSGADLWRTFFSENETVYEAVWGPAWHAGRLYLATGSGPYSKLRSVEASTGAISWSAVLQNHTEASSPAVTPDGLWLRGAGFYGFALTGAQRFLDTTPPQHFDWMPSVASDGIVFACTEGILRAHHPVTGAALWNGPAATTHCIANGLLYAASSSALTAVDLTTHAVRWTKSPSSGTYSGVPAVAQDVVFIQRGAVVDAVDGVSGVAIRSYVPDGNLGGAQTVSPQPVVTDDAVIFSIGGVFSFVPPATCIFDRATGMQRQSLAMSGSLALSQGTLLVTGVPQGSNVMTIKAWRAASALNPPPAAAAMSLSTLEEVAVAVTPQGSDPFGDFVYPVITTLPPGGSLYQTMDGITRGARIETAPALVTHADGTVIYAPAPDGSGDPFETWGFKMSDGRSLSPEATVTMNVTPVPDSPDAWPDTAFVRSGRGVLIAPLRNDRDRDGDALTLVSFTAPAHGSAAAAGADGIRYTPQAGFEGPDTFSYTVSDGTGRTAAASITVHVTRATDGNDWLQAGGDPGHSGYAPAVLGPALLTEQWTANSSPGTSCQPPCISRGIVIAAARPSSGQSYVQLLEASTGAEIRRQLLASVPPYFSPNPPSFADGRIYLQGNNGAASRLFCFEAATASLLWSAPYADYNTTHLAPAVAEGRVWINGGATGGLYGFHAAAGGQLFFHSLPQVGQWTPCYADGVVYSFVQGKLIAHHPDTGATLWELPVAASGDPAFAVAGGRAFLNAGGALVCVGLDSRTVKWTSRGFVMAGTPAVAAGIVYAMTNDGQVRAFDAASGGWLRTYLPLSATLAGQPVVTDDTLIVSDSSTTNVLDLATGALRQRILAGGRIAVAGERLFITSWNGALSAYGRPAQGNNVPVAYPVQTVLTENAQIAVSLEATDTDGDALRVAIATLPVEGTIFQTADGVTRGAAITAANTLVTDAAGRIIFVPAARAGGTGDGTFAFVATDARDVSLPAIVNIRITPLNDAPAARADVYLVRPGTVAHLRVTQNDNDPDDELVTVASWTTPEHGTLAAAPDGSLMFTPAPGYDGPDSFTYECADAAGSRASAMVSLLISSTAGRQWPMSGGGPRHTGYQPGALGNAPWSAGWSVAASGMNPQVAVAGGRVFFAGKTGLNATAPAFATALNAATGAPVWTRSLASTSGASSPAWHADKLYFAKRPGTDAARLYALNALSGADLWNFSLSGIANTAVASPVADDAGVWLLGSASASVLLGLHPNGSQRYQRPPGPVTSYPGAPALAGGKVYTWHSGVFRELDSESGAQLREKVWPWDSNYDSSVQQTPVLHDGRAFLTGAPGLYCVDLAAWSILWSRSGTHRGAVAVVAGEVYVVHSAPSGSNVLSCLDAATGAELGQRILSDYAQALQPVVTDDSVIVAGFSGTRILNRFTLEDRALLPGAVVNVAVADGVIYTCGASGQISSWHRNAVLNQLPVAAAATLTTPEDTAVAVSLSAVDSEADALQFQVSRLPSSGRLYHTADGITKGAPLTAVPASVTGVPPRLIYEPASHQNGINLGSFRFRAADAGGTSPEAQITIHVTPVNDPPQAMEDELVCMPGQWLRPLPLLANDRDPDGAADPLILSDFTQPAGGTVSLSRGGLLSYVPRGAATGSDTFTYTLTDGAGLTSTARVTIHRESGALDWPTLGGGPSRRGYAGRTTGTLPWGLAWMRPGLGTGVQGPAAADGRVYFTHSGQFAEALRVEDGATLWKVAVPPAVRLSAPTCQGGEMIFQRTNPPSDSQLHAVDALTGAPIWQAPYPEQSFRHLAPLVTEDGVWIHGGEFGGLYGLSRAGIERFWQLMPQYDAWTPARGPDGTVYAWVEGVLYAVHPSTGLVAWSVTTQWFFDGSTSINTVPAISGDFAVARTRQQLHGFDLIERRVAWTVEGEFAGSPAAGAGYVYVIQGNRVRSFRLRDGVPGLTYEAGESLDGQPLVTADLLFVQGLASGVQVFDLATAAKLQVLPVSFPLSAPVHGPLAMQEGTLLATDAFGIRAWRQETPLTLTPAGGTHSAPVTVTLMAGDPAARIHFSTDPLRPPGPESPWVPGGGTVTLTASASLAAVAVSGERVGLLHSASFNITDADDDSLPDWWELLHFPALTTAGRDGDSDCDAWSNLQEFLFGTSPADAAARPGLTLDLANSAPRLTWPTAPGRSYEVQASHDLTTWSVASPVYRGTGAPISFTGPVNARRFLRVRAFP